MNGMGSGSGNSRRAGTGNRGRIGRALVVLTSAALGVSPGASIASGISGAMGRPPLMARIYTSEVPSSAADEGQFIRIAVIIPPRAEVAVVEAFMDDENHGRSVDRWQSCDLQTGDCEIDGGRVEGLRRLEFPDHGEVLLDFWNEHPEEPRHAKLRVVFRPHGNLRKTYVPKECWLRTECGYAGWMDLTITDPDSSDEEGP
jgi:hypothetical protein